MSIVLLNGVHTDSDGRLDVRPAVAVAGASMYYAGPTFIAAKTDSVMWDKIDPNPPFTATARGFTTVTMYDNAGVSTTTEADAMYTMVDVTVDKDIELTGGALAVPNTLPAGNGDSDWRIWAFASPHVPEAGGGSIPFVEDLKIDGFYEGEDIVIDGRVTKYMPHFDIGLVGSPPTPVGLYANTIRFLLKHPTGLTPSASPASGVAKFQVTFDMYVKWA